MTEISPLPLPTKESILAARLTAGLSQPEAAACVHLGHYQQWQNWEAGRARMPLAAWELFLIKTGQRKCKPLKPKPKT